MSKNKRLRGKEARRGRKRGVDADGYTSPEQARENFRIATTNEPVGPLPKPKPARNGARRSRMLQGPRRRNAVRLHCRLTGERVVLVVEKLKGEARRLATVPEGEARKRGLL